MDRREFCLAGAVMATSFAVARSLQASPILLDVVIFDSRFGISVMPQFRKTEISDQELDALAAYLARNSPSN